MHRSMLWLALALSVGAWGCGDDEGACDRISEACHDADEGSGPEYECHELAEGDATDEECADQEEDCVAVCG